MRLRPALPLLLLLAGCPEPGEVTASPALAIGVREGPELSFDFGSVLVGDRDRRTLEIINPVQGTAKVRSIAVSPEDAGFGFEPIVLPHDVAAGDEASLAFAFAPAAEGAFAADLVLELDDSEPATLVLHLAGSGVEPRCSVTPAALDFGAVATGEPATRKVRVANGSGLPWTLLVGALEGDAAFRLVAEAGPLTVPPGGAVEVGVQLLAVAPGALTGALPLSGKGRCAPAKVPLAGTGVEQVLTVTPETLDFQGVAVGGELSRSLTLRNLSLADLHLTSLAVTSAGGAFALADPARTSLTVPATGAVEVGVTFRPTAAGAQAGQLSAATDDPKRTEIAVPLSGTGIP